MAVKEGSIIAGLDIGTTKICAIVGEVDDDRRIDIIGIGSAPSRGLRKGVVVNIEGTVKSIEKAVKEAELMAGVDLNTVFVGIAGSHIKGINNRGVVAVSRPNKEITADDVNRAIDAARAVAIPVDREVLHILPQEYIIDEQDGIIEPLGMSGVRLEVEVHIITAAVTSAQNLVKSVNRAGLEIEDIVLEQFASSRAALTDQEKEIGAVLIDIGGGTTDVIAFVNGKVRHTSVLGLGGNHVTNDIAVGLRTPTGEAERIKCRYGCACSELVEEDETIEVPSVGGRKPRVLSRQVLSEIIEPRMEEIFTLVKSDLKQAGFDETLLAAGMVVTGGASIMKGVPELAERIFDLPVRRGMPTNIGGLVDVVNSPIYSTGVGLVQYGIDFDSFSKFQKSHSEHMFSKILARMKQWFKEFF
ncbi:cell division protein FtsA [candidate division KSB3 bacterium]|uniref:Cell division protein FtsA n=1 Tax=candidate division KSB3 bacterium TaxID=2044937 RepID=A0A2G6E1Q8_9BACT|nr:MAG: cell division protein FtsA [candidate division KSB3 bacterium]PIE28510.1 MAG: cell division protein FtsA [candidate division KSB3 bacterium]